MHFNTFISSCFIFLEGKTWRGPLLLGTHKFTSSHFDQLFDLMQIPQVVIEY